MIEKKVFNLFDKKNKQTIKLNDFSTVSFKLFMFGITN